MTTATIKSMTMEMGCALGIVIALEGGLEHEDAGHISREGWPFAGHGIDQVENFKGDMPRTIKALSVIGLRIGKMMWR